MTRSKILSERSLAIMARKVRRRGKKIVFTNGTFDILHAGHVTYLRKAKELGDVLIVGVNSDASVKSYKSANRPVNPQEDRLAVLAALESVDYVVLFGDPTPIRLIRSCRPHYLVKGADWKRSRIAGAQEVRQWGGTVKRIRLVKGRSTTRILEKMGLE